MRFILECPLSTRIVNMSSELDLSPIVERIFANVTYFSTKCLHCPILFHTSLLSSEHHLTQTHPDSYFGQVVTTSSMQCATIFVALILMSPRRQLSLAYHHPSSVSTSVSAAHHEYIDGSVQTDKSAASAMFCPSMESPVEDEWLGRRLLNSSSSTFCELYGILLAVTPCSTMSE